LGTDGERGPRGGLGAGPDSLCFSGGKGKKGGGRCGKRRPGASV